MPSTAPHSFGDELPAELQRREERLQRIREPKRALEERARAEAEAEGDRKEGQGKVKPAPKAQCHFTDPDRVPPWFGYAAPNSPLPFGKIATANDSFLEDKVAAPESSEQNCSAGQWATDSAYYYVCIARNTWKRAVLTAW